jgi:hypothetical protein
MSTIKCFLFLVIKCLGLKLLMNECSGCTLGIVIRINLKFCVIMGRYSLNSRFL